MEEYFTKIKIDLEDKIKEILSNYKPLKKFEKIYKELNSKDSYEENLNDLLKNGVKLERNTHNKLFQNIDDVCNKLSINPELTIFKENETGVENAFIVAYKNKVIIAFCDKILNLINDEKELKSIISHEFGHYIYKHMEFNIYMYLLMITNINDSEFNKDEKKFFNSNEGNVVLDLFYILSQIMELNADRIALLGNNDFNSTVISSMKLMAGPVDNFGNYDPDSYIKQANTLINSKNIFNEEDLNLTHPYEPLRVKALDYFYNSDVFYNLTGKGENKYKLNEFNNFINKIIPIDLLDSNIKKIIYSGKIYNNKINNTSELKNENTINSENEFYDRFTKNLFLFMAVSFVISADEKITPKEEWFLARVVKEPEDHEKIVQLLDSLNDEEYENKFNELIEKAKLFPSRTKTGIMKNLMKAAKIDRKIDDREIETIKNIAKLIKAEEQCEIQLKNILGI